MGQRPVGMGEGKGRVEAVFRIDSLYRFIMRLTAVLRADGPWWRRGVEIMTKAARLQGTGNVHFDTPFYRGRESRVLTHLQNLTTARHESNSEI